MQSAAQELKHMHTKIPSALRRRGALCRAGDLRSALLPRGAAAVRTV